MVTTEETFDWRSKMAALEKQVVELQAMNKPTRVLLVDDEEPDLYITRRMLEHFNCSVTMCDRADQAIEMTASDNFDLVLMDFKMPHLNALEILRQVRAKSSGMARVVITTAMPVNAVVDEALRLGAVWTTKPLTEQVLKTFLRSKPA